MLDEIIAGELSLSIGCQYCMFGNLRTLLSLLKHFKQGVKNKSIIDPLSKYFFLKPDVA